MYKFQYVVFKIIQYILLKFSEKTRFKIAEKIGILGYHLIKKRRYIALANIKLAFPEKTFAEREKIVKESYKIMAKAFISSLWFSEFLEKNVKINYSERMENYIKNETKLAIGMIHMGSIEANLKSAKEYKTVTIAKKQRNPFVDEYITNERKKTGVILLKKSDDVSKELMEEINNGAAVALYTDHRDKGATVNFFGRETIAPTGVVFTALKYNLPLVIIYNVMNENNESVVHMSEEIPLQRTNSFKKDVMHNTQLMMSAIEDIIRKYPNQWLWFHDRWKLSKTMDIDDITK